MATSIARKAAALPSIKLAWGATGALPKLCAAPTAEPVAKPLPSERPEGQDVAQEAALPFRAQPAKSFKMHVGAALHIPTRDARDLPQMQPQRRAEEGVDPFEGLPFRGLAERLGASVMPSLEAAKQAERAAKAAARQAAEEAEVVVPVVPHVLPFTRWAAQSTKFRSTFIADPPKERKKARLSWYHPDDTMVPRDWFSGGLLEDLRYYSPFGLGGGGSEPAPAPAPAH